MRRKALIFTLGAGTLAGFASGLFGCHYHHLSRRQAFEDHVADVCLRAAERSHAGDAAPNLSGHPQIKP